MAPLFTTTARQNLQDALAGLDPVVNPWARYYGSHGIGGACSVVVWLEKDDSNLDGGTGIAVANGTFVKTIGRWCGNAGYNHPADYYAANSNAYDQYHGDDDSRSYDLFYWNHYPINGDTTTGGRADNTNQSKWNWNKTTIVGLSMNDWGGPPNTIASRPNNGTNVFPGSLYDGLTAGDNVDYDNMMGPTLGHNDGNNANRAVHGDEISTIAWDMIDASGAALQAGNYIIYIETTEFSSEWLKIKHGQDLWLSSPTETLNWRDYQVLKQIKFSYDGGSSCTVSSAANYGTQNYYIDDSSSLYGSGNPVSGTVVRNSTNTSTLHTILNVPVLHDISFNYVPTAAPTASITSHSSSNVLSDPSNGTDLNFTASTNGTGLSYSWKDNTVQFSTSASPTNIDLTDGSHNIVLTVTDAYSRVVSSATVVLFVHKAPSASITSPSGDTDHNYSVDGGLTFTGSGSDGDSVGSGSLSYRWFVDNSNQSTNSTSFTPSPDLSNGLHTIRFEVIDPDDSSIDTTDSVNVTIHADPSVTVSAPGSNYLTTDSPINLTSSSSVNDGAATGTIASRLWSVSTNNGMTLPGSPTGTSVTPTNWPSGTHTITLTVTDSYGDTNSDAATIYINALPTAGIDNAGPINILTTDTLTFTDTSSDNGSYSGGGSISTRLWACGDSNLNFATTNTGSISANEDGAYTAGTYTVTLTVTDNDGGQNVDSVQLVISDPSNTIPVVVITSPASTSGMINVGGSESFAATADDAEDGSNLDAGVDWSSNVDGSFPAGPSATADYSSAIRGDHTITASYTDLNSATGSDTYNLQVNGAPDTVTISIPSSNSILVDPAVSFLAQANDIDTWDSSLNLQWLIDGALQGSATSTNNNTNISFDPSGLNAGQTYTVGLRATDGNGLQATLTRTAIRINTAPSLSSVSPADNSVFSSNANVAVSASADDGEGGDVSTSITWVLNPSGSNTALGTGSSASTGVLSDGNHVVRASINDGFVTVTQDINITVGPIPTASMTVNASPLNNGSVILVSDTILGTGQDNNGADTGINVANMDWGTAGVSSTDLGTGVSSIGSLSAATYNITFTVQDDDGLIGSVTANNVIVHNAPTVSITSHTDNQNINGSQGVSLTANPADVDAAIPGANVVWKINTITQGQTGASITANLISGANTVLVTVTDSNGAVVTDTITINVNTYPTAQILTPVDNANYTVAVDDIPFSAMATDQESTPTITWSSSLDGNFGSTASF
ncbi:MAG: hypothetical protein HRU15_11905, partial [Planctomycetes bacterium]|nr:hypothetical protein [Planctomycetota bacterium]